MSNTRAWRAKRRTSKPNSRQKRNGLFLDAHPTCQRCNRRPAQEAHHTLPVGHPDRHAWQFLEALCVSCHVVAHQPARILVVINPPQV
jgi:5-methylcytosine-specific restriction endonuclease McrA